MLDFCGNEPRQPLLLLAAGVAQAGSTPQAPGISTGCRARAASKVKCLRALWQRVIRARFAQRTCLGNGDFGLPKEDAIEVEGTVLERLQNDMVHGELDDCPKD